MGMPVRSHTIGLEVHQRFHAALRNLSLVGGVGGVPSRVFQDVAQDDAGRVRAVVALADKALELPVFACQRLELCQCSRFGNCFGESPSCCCAQSSAARCWQSGQLATFHRWLAASMLHQRRKCLIWRAWNSLSVFQLGESGDRRSRHGVLALVWGLADGEQGQRWFRARPCLTLITRWRKKRCSWFHPSKHPVREMLDSFTLKNQPAPSGSLLGQVTGRRAMFR